MFLCQNYENDSGRDEPWRNQPDSICKNCEIKCSLSEKGATDGLDFIRPDHQNWWLFSQPKNKPRWLQWVSRQSSLTGACFKMIKLPFLQMESGDFWWKPGGSHSCREGLSRSDCCQKCRITIILSVLDTKTWNKRIQVLCVAHLMFHLLSFKSHTGE